MSRAEMIEEHNLSYDEVYDVPEPEECPECGEQTLFPATDGSYGADRDGNRGVRRHYYICAECGYEGEPLEEGQV